MSSYCTLSCICVIPVGICSKSAFREELPQTLTDPDKIWQYVGRTETSRVKILAPGPKGRKMAARKVRVFFRIGYNELAFLCNGHFGMKLGQKQNVNRCPLRKTLVHPVKTFILP